MSIVVAAKMKLVLSKFCKCCRCNAM